MEVRIELLALNIGDASGHEHRIQPIARRAAELLAENLEQQAGSDGGRGAVEIGNASTTAVFLDLNQTSDQQAAEEIARAWLDALAIHLEV
jgi:hypothetical protein